MSTTTKVTGLTYLNITALLQASEMHGLDVTLTATTATFPGTPSEALAALDIARNKLAQIHGTRGHPVASIPATRRKLVKLVDTQEVSQPVQPQQAQALPSSLQRILNGEYRVVR